MDEESQIDELTALESIYDETVFKIDRTTEPKGRIFVNPILPDGYKIKYQVKVDENSESSKLMEFQVKYLPPLTLYFVLPKTYPSQLNPAFLLSCCWLTDEQISLLCKKLDKLWLEGKREVILYKWIQFLQEESLYFLGINEVLDISDIPDLNEIEQRRLKRALLHKEKGIYKSSNVSDQIQSISEFEKNKQSNQKMHKETYLNQKYRKYNNTILQSNCQYKENNFTVNNDKCYPHRDYVRHKNYVENFHNKNYRHNGYDDTVSEQYGDKYFSSTSRTCQKYRYQNYNNNQNLKRREWNENTPIKEQSLEKKNYQTKYYNNDSYNFYRKNNHSRCTEFRRYHQREPMFASYKDNKKLRHLNTNWGVKLKNRLVTPMISGGNYAIDQRAISEIQNKSALIAHLTKYTKDKEEEEYNNNWFTCGVCLEEKQGKDFTNFSGCDHKYCKLCMKSYFEIQIQEGNVQSLLCPKEKCDSQATLSQIRDLVTPELYVRYDKLLLNSILECMSDVVYCPRIFCQTPVILEPDCSMGICPSCGFVFCIYCKMVYHGVASCQFKAEERKKIRDEYLKADKEEKLKMERRFGRRTLQMLVDEALSEEWVKNNSKNCPNCNSCIEKIDGCNKMTCWKCRTYFCWLCMTELKNTNPYEHFSNQKSPCFNQLFQGVEEFDDDDDDDDWEVGAFL